MGCGGEEGKKKLALSRGEQEVSRGGTQGWSRRWWAVVKGMQEGRQTGQDRRAVSVREGMGHTVTIEKARHLGVRHHTVEIVFV